MSNSHRADAIMLRMGFPAAETGPFVSELRARVHKQVGEGLRNRSGGTWGPGVEKLTHEDRAKHLLAMEWEMERAHAYEVKAFDGIIERRWDIKTMTRTTTVKWRMLMPWLGDRWREAKMRLRVWRDRYVLRLRNPYL